MDEAAMSTSKQTVLASAVEALANIVVGYLVAVAAQLMVFPIFGVVVTVADNLMIGGIFTAVSLGRSFVLRRLFEAIQVRRTP
jgi:hypothetical protein